MKSIYFIFSLVVLSAFVSATKYPLGLPPTNSANYFPYSDSLIPSARVALTPEQSRLAFHMPPGYHMELVASEPMITEPVAIAWENFRAKKHVKQLKHEGYI